jgi:ribulose-phosphate 3-epimerase
MVTIVPAILEKDITSFLEKAEKVKSFAKKVQVDIVDGKFAPAITVIPEALKEVDLPIEIEFEAHLMVEEPHEWVDRCVEAGITAVYGQVEKMSDKVAFIADAQFAGLRAGLAYALETPLTGLDEVINNLDAVLLMSSKLGSQGKEDFDEKVLEKIKEIRKIDKNIKIILDGGIDGKDIKRCFEAEWAEEIAEDELDRNFGKLEFAVGSELFKSENIEEEYLKLVNLSGV